MLYEQEFCDFSEIAEGYSDGLNMALNKITFDLEALAVGSRENSNRGEEKLLPKMKIPCIDFPVFESKPEEYEAFIQGFETLLNKYDLSQFEKLSYMRKQIKGQAKDIIDSVPDSANCYDIAKGLLERAFCKLTTQRFSVIERICKIKLDSSTPSLKWIGEIRTLREQITRLEINSDVFFQFFLWSGMSDAYKQEFISVTNKTKPDLEEILENAFEVVERINEMGGGAKLKKIENKNENFARSVTMTTDVSKVNYRKGCWLCQQDGNENYGAHTLALCPNYETPHSKISRIEELGGCTRCGLLNHKLSSCVYKFKGKCRNCSKYHSYYLCTKNSEKKKQNGTDINLVEVNVMSTGSLSADMVIPSFTTKIPKLKKGQLNTRVMYDPASQMTFISQNLLAKIRHDVVTSKTQIKISGFNESKIFDTKIVRVNCSIAGKNVELNATVVPEIKTKIKSPNFAKIKSLFAKNNLTLADKCLGDAGSVGILLGVDNAGVLPLASCVINGDANALVYCSKLGYLLAGDVSVLIRNPSYLEELKSNSEKFQSFLED